MNKRSSIRPGAADRLRIRLARLGRAPKTIAADPDPLWSGDGAEARRFASGRFQLAGALVEAPGASPFDRTAPTPDWSEALHAFDWLENLSKTSDKATRDAFTAWTETWIERYGAGAGPGWRADLAGRRLTQWIRAAPILLGGERPDALRAAIGRQTRYLGRRWRSALPGRARLEAAAGLVHAGLAIGRRGAVETGAAGLGREAKRCVAGDGGLPSRKPEDLIESFAALLWAARALERAGEAPALAHLEALPRLAAAIRALRHGDGAMARFHGGGAGDPERTDRLLAALGARPGGRLGETMGFHRLASGGARVMFDGGAPASGRRRGPAPAARTSLHASALCFEASLGGRPVVVNCGPGARFGETWRNAARATAAHSGLTIDERSSARVAASGRLEDAGRTSCLSADDASGARLMGEHDGWTKSCGLTHRRSLSLSNGGRTLRGEDLIFAEGAKARAAFDRALARGGRLLSRKAIPFAIRFHLHPLVEADIFLAGGAVRLETRAGQVWVMRQTGGALAVEDSVYLDETLAEPRATKQIVVRGEAKDYSKRVRWSFRRAEPQRPGADEQRNTDRET